MSVSFAVGLMQENNSGESVVFSPMALGAALASVHHGAEDGTKRQLNNILLPGESTRSVSKFYSGLASKTREGTLSIDMHMMNKVLLKEAPKFDWKEDVERDFAAAVSICNFDQMEEVIQLCTTLNEECRRTTKDFVDPVVDSDNFTIHNDLQMIAVNAAYFKGLWWINYQPPRPRVFYGVPNRQENFLSKVRKAYVSELGSRSSTYGWGVGLPFDNQPYRFWMILPLRRTLSEMIFKLTAEDLNEFLRNASYESGCRIIFPEFNAVSSIPAKECLQKAHRRSVPNSPSLSVFTDEASLPNISNEHTRLADIVHHTALVMNGEGTTRSVLPASSMSQSMTSLASTTTTGSTSTYQSSTARSYGPITLTFEADRPFLYLVTVCEDGRTNKILFCGTYY